MSYHQFFSFALSLFFHDALDLFLKYDPKLKGWEEVKGIRESYTHVHVLPKYHEIGFR